MSAKRSHLAVYCGPLLVTLQLVNTVCLLDVENDDWSKSFCSKTYWNGLYDSPCAGRFSIPVVECVPVAFRLWGGDDGVSCANSTYKKSTGMVCTTACAGLPSIFHPSCRVINIAYIISWAIPNRPHWAFIGGGTDGLPLLTLGQLLGLSVIGCCVCGLLWLGDNIPPPVGPEGGLAWKFWYCLSVAINSVPWLAPSSP
jgi:hypothetical protein